MLITTYLPEGKEVYIKTVGIAKMGMIYTLFLIGTGLSKDNIKEVGFSPILLGIMLWLVISILSAVVILFT